MKDTLRQLEDALERRWDALAPQLPEPLPKHAIEFSSRITSSWALIYYRRKLIRLSPYLFLLEPERLRAGSHWGELERTLRHEMVHAHLYARDRETGHPPEFARLLAGLGVDPNGAADLGPTNVAYRYVYACPACGYEVRRRRPIKNPASCGPCSPGAFDERYQLQERRLPPLRSRLAAQLPRMEAALADARRTLAPEERAPATSEAGGAVTRADAPVGVVDGAP